MTNDKARILVIEDSDDDFYAFERACRQLNVAVEITRCTTVGAARQRLGESWSVLFLDLNLPGTSGREFLAELKSGQDTCELPVVIYTTSDSKEDIRYCYVNHANAYHVKPMKYDEMRDELATILEYWTKRVEPPREETP